MQGGAAVLSLQGPLRIEPIVAQGCRPLTDSTWLVDKSENNIIMQVNRHAHPDSRACAVLLQKCVETLTALWPFFTIYCKAQGDGKLHI